MKNFTIGLDDRRSMNSLVELDMDDGGYMDVGDEINLCWCHQLSDKLDMLVTNLSYCKCHQYYTVSIIKSPT